MISPSEKMPAIEVSLEIEATPKHIAAVEAAFQSAGIEARVAADYERKSFDVLPWVVYVTLATPIAAFFHSFAAEAGKDSYATVKTWLRALLEARHGAGGGKGSVVLRDPEHTNLVVSSEIADNALDALADLDWGTVRGDYLVWDETRSEWRDPTGHSR